MSKIFEKGGKSKAFHSVFKGSNAGIKVLEYLMKVYYNVPSYVPNNREDTFFNEGKRAVVADILREIEKAEKTK